MRLEDERVAKGEHKDSKMHSVDPACGKTIYFGEVLRYVDHLVLLSRLGL